MTIHSALRLPELSYIEQAPDVTVRFDKITFRVSETSEGGLVSATETEAWLFFESVGMFLIREGREIVIDPVPGTEERLLRLVVLGPGLGAVLYQRGVLPLHASVVGVADGAVAFMGERGEGKSTMAAAMHGRGHLLLADDIAAVQSGTDYPLVIPGYPQLKLWPEAVRSLGDNPEVLPRVDPSAEKRARSVDQGFVSATVPLRRIYVLTFGDAPEIERLKLQESLLELVRHTYGRKLLMAVGTPSHFLRCSNIVKHVSVCRLRRPRSLSMLSDVARLVEADLAREKAQNLHDHRSS